MTAADPFQYARGCVLPQRHIVLRGRSLFYWSSSLASAPSALLLGGPLRLPLGFQVGTLQSGISHLHYICSAQRNTHLEVQALVIKGAVIIRSSQICRQILTATNNICYAGSRTTTSDLLQAFRSLPLSSSASRTPTSTADYPADRTLSLLTNNRRSLLQNQLQGEKRALHSLANSMALWYSDAFEVQVAT